MTETNFRKHHHSDDEDCNTTPSQTHVHEFEGSVEIAEQNTDPHNHRFAGVSSEVISVDDSHVHEIVTNTDFYEDHHHEVGIRTGLPIDVGDGRHVHFATGSTTMDDGHFHNFRFATLIQDPIGD